MQREELKNCTACELCKTRTQVVFGKGPSHPLLFLVGEGPGEEEDRLGEPFVGKAGQKLDKILSYIGLNRDEVYITNSVLCRPPDNRIPKSEELLACRARLFHEIQTLKPRLIIALGKTAFTQLTGKAPKVTLRKLLNSEFTVEGIRTRVTYHPAFHLRSPERAYQHTLPHWTEIKEWIKTIKLNA